jgi:glycosyltransferase involved in cell wall biosynthesis
MRILHAYNQHRGGGGADNSTRTTIDVQRRHGFDVEVYTRSSEDLPRNLRGRLLAASSVAYAPTSVREFGRMLDSFRPDVVHAHEVFPLVSPWILPLCTRREIPVVMTCVDYRMTCPIVTHLRGGELCTQCTGGREYWAVLRNCRGNLPESVTVAAYNFIVRKLRLFSNHVAQFIAPSEFTRRWLIEHAGIEAGRITTISPVVTIPEAEADPGEGRYIAYAGRFTPEKGIATLVEAARLCAAPFRLARAENSLVTVDLPPSPLEVVVTRNRDELEAFYSGARMLVAPSIWFETFGLVAAEAMAFGVPVIASRLGSLSHLVDDGVDGVLFDPGNSRDLADKVSWLWNNPARCRELGSAARKKAKSLWSPERHFTELARVYEDLIGL